jgi:hypothetical protein
VDIFENGKKVVETPAKAEPIETTSTSNPNPEIVKELKMRPLREYFGTHEYNDDKLEEIVKWANPDGKLSNEEIMGKIKHISSTVGQGQLGETELEKVWKFIKIFKSFTSMVENV